MMAADVSERKALEANIQHNQRLESLGVMAGGIAHDFNNPLTGVLGNASVLQDRFHCDSREARAASDLIMAGQVMAKLTSQMLAYAGRGRFHIERLDLSTAVRQISNLVQSEERPFELCVRRRAAGHRTRCQTAAAGGDEPGN
jgi:C4-dicarboxylate-specific signal transduction histidine kinase